jgi:hypothetical protein
MNLSLRGDDLRERVLLVGRRQRGFSRKVCLVGLLPPVLKLENFDV